MMINLTYVLEDLIILQFRIGVDDNPRAGGAAANLDPIIITGLPVDRAGFLDPDNPDGEGMRDAE